MPKGRRAQRRPERVSVEEVVQLLAVALCLQPGQRLGLDLADALPRQAEGCPYLIQGAWTAVGKAEAQLDKATLARR